MNKLRFVTAASLFDGHDVSINIMRRLLQSSGVEVVHLGHNRSAQEVVDAVLHEDAHAVALSSYQGGHNEYFSYIRELLDKAGAKDVRIFGGGGGVITPLEIKNLHEKGITRIYSPEDGMKIGLQGIIQDMIEKSKYSTLEKWDLKSFEKKNLKFNEIAKVITYIEDEGKAPFEFEEKKVPVLGITGTGGAGKSSLIDELLLRFHRYYKNKKVALISIDPTRKKTQGALLGDRIRLGSASYDNFYIRSLATRDSNTELSPQISKVTSFLKSQDLDLIIVETSGIGQASDEITKVADKCIYVMTPEYGAATQLEKIEMIEQADFIVLNKFEKPRSEDALRDIRKQYRRDRKLFAGHPGSPDDSELPIFGTMASHFNDPGVNELFREILNVFDFDTQNLIDLDCQRVSNKKLGIIPPEQSLYLREIAKVCRDYNQRWRDACEHLKDYEALNIASKLIENNEEIEKKAVQIKTELPKEALGEIKEFDQLIEQYKSGVFSYEVRGKTYEVPTVFTSLSGSKISKVAFPNFNSLSEKYKFIKNQNLPGFFPYVAGIFPIKRSDEEPKRMFAGEGGPTRTNKRFHYLSKDDPAKRLSTAFDSVTLYGSDPAIRPDIFGKIGEAGVSIATLDDMFDLYDGFDLTSSNTSVSMTINGPAPIILAMFMNTAMKQSLKGNDFWMRKKELKS